MNTMTNKQYEKMIDLEYERGRIRDEYNEQWDMLADDDLVTPEMLRLEKREVAINRKLAELEVAHVALLKTMWTQ